MLSDQEKKASASLQEVVKFNLMLASASMPALLQVEQNTCIIPGLATKKPPTVKILIGNATIRFFNPTDKSQIETTLK